MPKVGVEPTRGCPQWFLRPPRLPFRHYGLRRVLYGNWVVCVNSERKHRVYLLYVTRVREAALFRLPFLKARDERSQLSQRLLRASSGLDTPTRSLLGPVCGSHESDPVRLLRASSEET